MARALRLPPSPTVTGQARPTVQAGGSVPACHGARDAGGDPATRWAAAPSHSSRVLVTVTAAVTVMAGPLALACGFPARTVQVPESEPEQTLRLRTRTQALPLSLRLRGSLLSGGRVTVTAAGCGHWQ